jgi:hypothetical protein
MLLKESVDDGAKEGRVELGDFVVDEDVVERIKWVSGTMYAGKKVFH